MSARIRHVTAAPEIPRSGADTEYNPAEGRFELRRLCDCENCNATGKALHGQDDRSKRCPECRGEGRTLQLVASCDTPEAVGVALVTLAREGEFEDCPFGCLDTMGEPGKRWLIKPWHPSPRNFSDAGRLLNEAKRR